MFTWKKIWVVGAVTAIVALACITGLGVWPGQPLIDDSAVGAQRRSQPVAEPGAAWTHVAGRPIPYRDQDAARSDWLIDTRVRLLDQAVAFPEAVLQENPAIAGDLARAWRRCQWHSPLPEAHILAFDADAVADAIGETADRLATHPDQATREVGAEVLAEIDPTAVALDQQAEMRWQNSFCAGVETLPGLERAQRHAEALQRAAVLGDPRARREFVLTTFEHVDAGSIAELARKKPLVREMVEAGLADGDPYMLGEAARIHAMGYFDLPDPERAYAYSQAYLALVDADRAYAWRQGDFRLYWHDGFVALDQGLASQLDEGQRNRALALAERLADCCRGDGS